MMVHLRYHLSFLEHSDARIAEDAFAELCFGILGTDNVSLSELASGFFRTRLAVWISDPEIPEFRRVVCGNMLRLCGTPEDAVMVKKFCPNRPHGGMVDLWVVICS